MIDYNMSIDYLPTNQYTMIHDLKKNRLKLVS